MTQMRTALIHLTSRSQSDHWLWSVITCVGLRAELYERAADFQTANTQSLPLLATQLQIFPYEMCADNSLCLCMCTICMCVFGSQCKSAKTVCSNSGQLSVWLSPSIHMSSVCMCAHVWVWWDCPWVTMTMRGTTAYFVFLSHISHHQHCRHPNSTGAFTAWRRDSALLSTPILQ